MKKPLERDIQKACLQWLALAKVFAWRNNSAAMVIGEGPSRRFLRAGIVGGSDVLGILPGGKLMALEIKRPGGKTTEAQEAFLQRVRDAGGVALVITSVEELIQQVSPLLAARG